MASCPHQVEVTPSPVTWLLSIILSGFAMIVGGSIYIGWRSDPPLFISWLKDSEMASWMGSIQHALQNHFNTLPEWMIYSLPNALWAFAYSNLICLLWHQRKGWGKALWVATAPLLPIAWELSQFLNVIPGVFCWADLSLGLVGAVAGILMFTNKVIGS